MSLNEYLIFTIPLLAAGIIHHFLIIRYNLFAQIARPIDFGFTLRGARLLGKAKTFRGFAAMMIISGITMWWLNTILNIPLKFHAFISGAIIGFGYSLGELPNSFLKRRLGIKESEPAAGPMKIFFLLDHTDSVVGSIISLFIIYSPSMALAAALFISGTSLHLALDGALYRFSYKNKM